MSKRDKKRKVQDRRKASQKRRNRSPYSQAKDNERRVEYMMDR
jgi:hypothetical protein